MNEKPYEEPLKAARANYGEVLNSFRKYRMNFIEAADLLLLFDYIDRLESDKVEADKVEAEMCATCEGRAILKARKAT